MALTVGLRLPLWGAGIVFAASLLATRALTRDGWLGVVSAAALGALGVTVALVMSPTVWLSCVTGAAMSWYTALTLLYSRGESASVCQGGTAAERQGDAPTRRAHQE